MGMPVDYRDPSSDRRESWMNDRDSSPSFKREQDDRPRRTFFPFPLPPIKASPAPSETEKH